MAGTPSPCVTFFIHGLADRLKDQMTPLELPKDPKLLISLSDENVFERKREKSKSLVFSFTQRGQCVLTSSLWVYLLVSSREPYHQHPLLLRMGHSIAFCLVKDRAHL